MYIKAKVKPNSRKELFKKITEDTFEIEVKEKAIQNMANRKVLELFSDYFSIPKGNLKIVSGHRSPNKIISMEI